MDGARVRLANTGTRGGREVVQLYASKPDSAVERPARWLVGFAVVEAAAGEEVIVDVPLSPRAFDHWADGAWQREPGEFVLEAGRSVADLKLRATVTPWDTSGGPRPAGPPAGRPLAAARAARGPVELRQLEYFAAVARHRHFTRAAESLYVTQPALSQQVRRLEAELGLQLFRRTSKGVELTSAGEDLLVHAETILAEVAQTRADMDRHTGVSRGVVRVATTAADAPRLPAALAAFHHEHPHIQIALRQGSAAEIVALVQAGTVDVAVLALTDTPPGVTVTPLEDEPLRAAVPVDDELAGTTIELDQLRGRPFILAEPGTRAARHGHERHAARRVQPAAAVRGRRPGDGAVPGARGPRRGTRPGVLAGTAGAGRRRGGPQGPTAPPAVAAHARGGGVTGRPAAARAPRGALTPGACAAGRRRGWRSARRRRRA